MVSTDNIQTAILEWDYTKHLFILILIVDGYVEIETFDTNVNPLIRDANDVLKLYNPNSKQWDTLILNEG